MTADRGYENDEPNYRVYGITDTGRLLTIAWTVRKKGIRPITGWPMTKQERNRYEQQVYKNQQIDEQRETEV